MPSTPIVFIHGMYMTSLCWDEWMAFFRARGYECRAPNWPGRDAPIEELRKKHPDPALGTLTLRDVIDRYVREIEGLREPPIVIGHSMGGLVVQLLLQSAIVRAGVAIDSAPPLGVFSARWSLVKSNWPHVNPFVSRGVPIAMTFERFQYTFVNGWPLDEQREAFERYVVPESRRVPAESLTRTARIAFRKPHAPLLLVAGSEDHLIPPSLNRSNQGRYSDRGSVTDFKEFAGRTHSIIGQKGWEEVAGYIESWLQHA